eukprot:2079568-Amphidinium_carterae.1
MQRAMRRAVLPQSCSCMLPVVTQLVRFKPVEAVLYKAIARKYGFIKEQKTEEEQQKNSTGAVDTKQSVIGVQSFRPAVCEPKQKIIDIGGHM